MLDRLNLRHFGLNQYGLFTLQSSQGLMKEGSFIGNIGNLLQTRVNNSRSDGKRFGYLLSLLSQKNKSAMIARTGLIKPLHYGKSATK